MKPCKKCIKNNKEMMKWTIIKAPIAIGIPNFKQIKQYKG